MYIFFFSFLLVPPTVVLFWHEDKTKKSTIQTRVKLLTCFYRKKILLDTYFTSIIYHTTDQHKNFLLFTKIQFGKPVQHLQLPQHREGKIDLIPSSSTSSYFIGLLLLLFFYIVSLLAKIPT